MDNNISDIKPTTGTEGDYRSLGPIRVCPCGSDLWNVKCKFDYDGEIGIYFLDMSCCLCGSSAVAPMPDWKNNATEN
jgi:hypothetical protein